MLTTETADTITSRFMASMPQLTALDNLLQTIEAQARELITPDHSPRMQEELYRSVTRRLLLDKSDAEVCAIADSLPLHLKRAALWGSMVDVLAMKAEALARIDSTMSDEDGDL